MHGRGQQGHAWQGVCVAGGGHAWQGCARQGVCEVGSVHGRGQGACVSGGGVRAGDGH